MAAPKWKLTYFEARSLAEPIRYMFFLAGVDFENVTVKYKDFAEMKPDMPFGQIPVLEFDGHKVGQSRAICRYVASQLGYLPEGDVANLYADAVCDTLMDIRMPAVTVAHAFLRGDKNESARLATEFVSEHFEIGMMNLEKFIPNSEFITGTKMTWADIFLATMAEYFEDAGKLFGYSATCEAYPKISAIQQRVFSCPAIKEYRKNRPVGEFDL